MAEEKAEGTEGEEGSEDKSKEEPWKAEDVKKLQSTLNKQADGLRKQVAGEREARAKAESRAIELEAQIEEQRDEEPDAAGVKALRAEVLKVKRQAQQFQQRGWDLAVKSAATELALEFGLSTEERDELTTKLNTAAENETGLKLAADQERLDRQRAQHEEAVAAAAKKDKPEVDAGQGTATRRDLIDEMEEARRSGEWVEKREGFAKRVFAEKKEA